MAAAGGHPNEAGRVNEKLYCQSFPPKKLPPVSEATLKFSSVASVISAIVIPAKSVF